MGTGLRTSLLLALLAACVAFPAAADDVTELRSIDGLLERGEAEAALARVEALLSSPELEPRNRWRARLRLGAALVEVGRPAEAIPVLEGVLREVDDATAHLNLARALVATGQRGRAVSEYDQALLLDPAAALWRLEYSGLLLDLGAVRDARGQIDEARRLCGDCPESLRAAANLALLRGDHAAAIGPLAALLALGAGPEIRARLVASRWNIGDLEGVAALLDPLATPTLSGDEVMVLAQLERQRQRTPRVLAWIESPEQQLPPGWTPPAEFWAMSAEVCLRADRPQEALVAIDRALEQQPAVALYHHNRAAALVALGRQDAARQALAEARRLDPGLGEGP